MQLFLKLLAKKANAMDLKVPCILAIVKNKFKFKLQM